MPLSNKIDSIRKVCNKYDISYLKARKAMTKVSSDLDITFKEYYDFNLYEMSPVQQVVAARKIINRRNLKRARLDKISKETGLTYKQIFDKLRMINEKNIINITVLLYHKYEMYRYNDEEIDAFLHLMVKRNLLKEKLLVNLEEIDNGNLSYNDITESLDEFYDIIDKLTPESLFEDIKAIILPSRPELENNYDELKRIAIDLEACRVLFEFSQTEYAAFHFAEKNIEEKHKFISDKERIKVLEAVNEPSKFEILDDKFKAYNILKDHYHRNMIEVNSSKDYKNFKGLCDNNKKLVVKSRYETMGRGIRLIEVPKPNETKALFNELLLQHKSFIVEELINAHDAIKALNPDSVNTVRVITYFDGNESIIHDTFMKVGQKGSFVDNGGAGGILISVDPVTGVLNTSGIDERGVRYERHPYTGVTFDGYQLPDWASAIALCLEISNSIPGLNYIGWDITYTSDNRWVIVEGNSKTQFFGQQCTINAGVRENFLKIVGYKK